MDAFKKWAVSIQRLALQEHDVSAVQVKNSDSLEILFKPTRIGGMAIVRPLAGAGVDAFHLSQRRYWEGEFGTEANLATWTKRLTGKPTITVGSITLDNSVAEMMRGEGSLPENNLTPLLAGLERGDFDLVAVGRALIANPDWPHRLRPRDNFLRPHC